MQSPEDNRPEDGIPPDAAVDHGTFHAPYRMILPWLEKIAR
jgi:hypothetical protein